MVLNMGVIILMMNSDCYIYYQIVSFEICENKEKDKDHDMEKNKKDNRHIRSACCCQWDLLYWDGHDARLDQLCDVK